MAVFIARQPSKASVLFSLYPEKAWSLLPTSQVKEPEPKERIFFSKLRWVYSVVAISKLGLLLSAASC